MSELNLDVAETAGEQVRRWDAGQIIWSIEMGGLGPGYEQAIQVLAVEITRDNLGKPLPKDGTPYYEWADETVRRIDYKREDGTYAMGGFSGAQVGAAKQLAYHWLKSGPRTVFDQVTADRKIQVSKYWPHAEASA